VDRVGRYLDCYNLQVQMAELEAGSTLQSDQEIEEPKNAMNSRSQ
jgi:hypothetical protein